MKIYLGWMDSDACHFADAVMLATERRDVILPGPEWNIELPEPLPEPIEPWGWRKAERKFLLTAEELRIR